MKLDFLRKWLSIGVVLLGMGAPLAAHAEDLAPDEMIKRLSAELLDTIKNDKSVRAGDIKSVIALVDTKVMPNVNFARMTAATVGPNWNKATPEQQKRLQEEFKILLVSTYAGALSQVSNQSITLKPLRAAPEDKEVLVRSEVKGKGDPVELSYRLEKTPGQGYGWKIYDLNAAGVWMVANYKTQFSQEINAKGIDGLISSLAAQNKANAAKKG